MQQLFRLLIFFNSALHVSGDKFAHPQEHFFTIYSFWYNVPTLLPTGSTLAPVGNSVGALYRKLYIQSKSAPEDGRICRPEKCRAYLKRLINEKVVASFLLVIYIVVKKYVNHLYYCDGKY